MTKKSLQEQMELQSRLIDTLQGILDTDPDAKVKLKAAYTLTLAQKALSEMQRLEMAVSRRGRTKNIAQLGPALEDAKVE